MCQDMYGSRGVDLYLACLGMFVSEHHMYNTCRVAQLGCRQKSWLVNLQIKTNLSGRLIQTVSAILFPK